MNHGARRAEHASRGGQCARGGDRPAPARGAGAYAVAPDLCLAAAPELPALFWRPADFAHRELGAKHGPGLARLRTDRLEDAAGSRDRRGFGPDAAFFRLGRLGGRSASQTSHRPVHTNRHDAVGFCLCLPGVDPPNPELAHPGAVGLWRAGDGVRHARATGFHGGNDQPRGPHERDFPQQLHRERSAGRGTIPGRDAHGGRRHDCLFPGERPQFHSP